MSDRIVLEPVAGPPAVAYGQSRPICDRLLPIREVAARVGLCRAEIYKRVQAGRFPALVKLGTSSRWSEREVADWIERQKAGR